MASIPGRPYNVGYTFRIISATTVLWQNVETLTEYRYDTTTWTLSSTVQHVTSAAPRVLGRGDFLEYTAGRGVNEYTVVYIKCQYQCEVSYIHCVSKNVPLCNCSYLSQILTDF